MKIEPSKLSSTTEPIISKTVTIPEPVDQTINCLVWYEWDPLYPILSNLSTRLRTRDEETDTNTPSYHMMQRISSQINRAQSGEGPFRARLMDIAEIALAAILSIDRS